MRYLSGQTDRQADMLIAILCMHIKDEVAKTPKMSEVKAAV